MSGRIVSIETSAHQAIQELLPWFVMDKLEGAELDMVREHLAGCAQCRADADWQRRLQTAEPGAMTAPDVESAWMRMQARLDDVPVAQPGPKRTVQSAKPGNMVVECIRRLLSGSGTWMPWALAAQFIVIAGLAVMVAHLDGESSAYRAASFHALGTPKNATGNIMIMFRPEASAQELQRILLVSGVRVVDGPTSTGAWLVNVDDARLSSTVKTLRAERAVALAEPLVVREAP